MSAAAECRDGTRIFGAPIKRKEDPRLLRGNGRYIADVKLHGMLVAAVVRSPHAHAWITSIDASTALADPRAHAVLTAADLPAVEPLVCIDAEETTEAFNQPILAADKVRYVGEPVAVVVAAERGAAEDIAELVTVDYEPLEAVIDPERAVAEDAPIVHRGTNVADTLEYEIGNPDAAFESAPHVLRERYATQRYAGTPIETRGMIAEWDERTQTMTLWSSTQVPNTVKGFLLDRLGLPENGIRVRVPDIGGAFGVKIQIYPEEVLICIIARRLGRPVKWIEDRWEHFVATTHGREQIHDVEVAYDDEGRILAIRDKCITNTGAYLQSLTLVEPFIGVAMLTGPYEVPNFKATSVVAMTNKTPMNPFRGVGHVQAAFTMERVMDTVARALGLDPAEIRVRNLIAAESMPVSRGIGNVLAGEIVYDSGDYNRCLQRVLEFSGYADFAGQREAARGQGRRIGIGIGAFVEETGLGPYESGTVRVEPSGQVVVLSGASPSGQGHLTTLAQVAADELGVSIADVDVVVGDTDLVRWGVGTYASRTAAVGGTAVRNAATAVREKLLGIAAHMIEADVADLQLSDGQVRVVGSPSAGISLGEIAAYVKPGAELPDGIDDYGIEATDVYHPSSNTFSYGVHVSKVEVDGETGVVTLLEHHVVNDSGTVVNPLILEGQVQGGVALGVGGALLEEIRYRDDGQPANPSFMDYLLPTVEAVPMIEVEHMEVASPINPDGVKGGGEGGAVGAPAAIANAVADAIHPARITATPITPDRVFGAMVEAGMVQPPRGPR